MDIANSSEEFIGCFVASFIDGETIYAYDRVTLGLYKLNLSLGKVDMLIPPESVHQNTKNIILGISKRGNELILIPQFIDDEWIFYNEKKKEIRYSKVVENKICIADAVTIGSSLFLIPLHMYEPIIIVSLDSGKPIKVYKDWYAKHINNSGFVWGSLSYGDGVIFPVVQSKEIACVNHYEVNIIEPNISNPISSISIFQNKIWILPVSGEYIYSTNFNGEVLERIALFNEERRVCCSEFCKIIAVKDTIFLLPFRDKKLCAYQIERKKLIEIKSENTPLEKILIAQISMPYLEFVIEKGMLYLLPCEFRFKSIYISSLESREHRLQYGDDINCAEYLKMIKNEDKEIFTEKGKNDLRVFLQEVVFGEK